TEQDRVCTAISADDGKGCSGAARSLGAALAIVSADRGAHPILLGRSLPPMAEMADTILSRTGKRPDIIECDLADLGSVAKAAETLTRDHPDLDILVNSGATWVGGAFQSVDDEQIAAMVDSMLTGTMALTRRLLPVLRARPH